MRHETPRRALRAALGILLLAAPGLAQQREYYVRGKVLDTARQPVPGVEIRLLDVATSRRYELKTDKQGVFKLAGLPHGVYEVAFTKDGYTPKQDQWKFETPQETMQTVQVPDVFLASQALVEEARRVGEATAGVKEAGEKLRQGDPDGAIAALQGVLANDPHDANALFFLGMSYSKKKMCREAVPALARVTELTPRFPPAHFQLAVCYGQLGEREKALAAYETTLELDAENADAAYNSGLILFEMNRIDEALVRFDRGLTAKPEDPDLLEMAGRCLLHQGKFQVAVERLEKALVATTDPDKKRFLEELLAKTKSLVP